MTEIITAVYERGVLRPARPLQLKEQQTVRLQILPESEVDDLKAIIEAMIAEGVIASRPIFPDDEDEDFEMISEDELARLAWEVGQAPGKTLSEIIIEERGEW